MLLWEKLAQADQKPINSQFEFEKRKTREDKYTETSLSHGSHDRRTRLLLCASLVAQMVKNLPARQETWVWSLGWENSWRRECQSSPVFLLAEFHGQRSLEGYSPWGRQESDMTEWLTFSFFKIRRLQSGWNILHVVKEEKNKVCGPYNSYAPTTNSIFTNSARMILI